MAGERMPGGHRRAGQGGGGFVTQMVGNAHQPVLVQHHRLGEHAVDAAAERRAARLRGDPAIQPALHEDGGHPVARGEAGHARPDRLDLARAVRQRHQVRLQAAASVGAAHHHQVTVIQTGRAYPDAHLERAGFGHRLLAKCEPLDAGRLGDAPKFQVTLLCGIRGAIRLNSNPPAL